MMRFILVFLFAVSVRAESPCESMLSSSSAAAYVNLIQLSLKNLDSAESTKLIDKVLAAKHAINPFVGRIDTFSGQISAAIDPLVKKINKTEWQHVKKRCAHCLCKANLKTKTVLKMKKKRPEYFHHKS